MQVFNFINARKINDEINTFSNIHRSHYFIIIVIAIFGLQALLVSIGGYTLTCYSYGSNGGAAGLNATQWVISIIIGSFSLLINIFLKIIKEDALPMIGKKEKDPGQRSGVLLVKKKSMVPAAKSQESM